MVQTSFALMTNVGRAKEAAALANGTTINVTQIAIGDGSTVPSGGETALYNEIARKSITGHGTVVGSSNVAYFDAYLTAAEGPYTIREAGLFDDTGALIAIAYYNPPISKPIPSSGQTIEATIRLEVAFSNVANITIVVDPSFQVALQRLSRLPWIPVISMTTTAPPGSPAVGDCYLIPTGATGSWSGNAGKIAEYTTAGWAMITAAEGHGISMPDGRVFEKISGAYTEKLALDAQSGKWSYIAAAGTANALTATLAPAPAALTTGMPISLNISTTNTNTAVTLNVNGLGAKAIKMADGGLPAVNEVNGLRQFVYDGTSFIMTNVVPATKLVRGVVELATAAEATAGTDASRVAAVAEMATAVQSGGYAYAVAGGTANALTATLVPAPAALVVGMKVRLKITSGNTGGATLNVNGLGAVGIVRSDLTGLLNNDLVVGTTIELIYNGSFWQLVGLLNTTKPFYQGVAAAGGTLTVDQIGTVVQFGVGAGAYTVNLPLSSTCPNGGRINFFHNGNNPVTLQVQGSDQIGYADGTLSSSIIVNTGDTLELLCLGLTGTWLVIDGSMGNRAASDFKKILSGNGYQKLPGGLILQWGTATGSTSGTVTVTFPITFATACYSVAISVDGASTSSINGLTSSLSTTGFGLTTTFAGSFAALTAHYIAIGK